MVQALVALETQSATVLHGPWASCWPSQLQCAAVHLEPEMQDEGAKVKPAGAEGQAWTAAEAAGLELPRLELSDAEKRWRQAVSYTHLRAHETDS